MATLSARVEDFGLLEALYLLLSMALLAFAPGCQREEDKVEIDPALLGAEVARRAEGVVARPAVEQQLEKLIEGAFRDPALAKSGEGLLAALGSAPELVPHFEEIQGEVSKLPAMERLVQELVKTHPGANPQQIGELAGQRVEAVTSSAEFNMAFEKAFGHLMARPAVQSAFLRFGKLVGENPEIERSIVKALDLRATDQKLRRRIVELAGGKAPTKQWATEIVVEHAFSEARIEGFYVDLFSLPALSREISTMCRELVAAPAFQKHARKALATLVGDPSFRKEAVQAFSALIERGENVNVLASALRKPLDTPTAERALVEFMKALEDDPELSRIGNRALSNTVRDPALGAAVARLIEGW